MTRWMEACHWGCVMNWTDWARRALFICVLLLAYAGLHRPLRKEIIQNGIIPLVQHLNTGHEVELIPRQSPGVYVRWNRDTLRTVSPEPTESGSPSALSRNTLDLFTFRGFGDKFFLLGALYFLAMGMGWKPVGWLFLIHQGITLLSLVCLLLAVTLHPAWLYAMNLLVTYITPAATGMFVLGKGRKG